MKLLVAQLNTSSVESWSVEKHCHNMHQTHEYKCHLQTYHKFHETHLRVDR